MKYNNINYTYYILSMYLDKRVGNLYDILGSSNFALFENIDLWYMREQLISEVFFK